MTVIALLANGVLQQLVQPIAFGATLGIHPLAVLVVTIAGGGCSARSGWSSPPRSPRRRQDLLGPRARPRGQTEEREPPPEPAAPG